jgi:hypothetical protein
MGDSSLPKTVLLRGDPLAGEGTVITAAITPGMAVGISGDSVALAGAAYIAPSFARENEIVGGGIDTEMAVGDNIMYYTPRKGDWLYAFLANTESVTAGDTLQCLAGGVLGSVDAGTPVARALETLNNTSGASARLKVEIV